MSGITISNTVEGQPNPEAAGEPNVSPAPVAVSTSQPLVVDEGPVATPEPEPTFRTPGQPAQAPIDPAVEAEWLRQQYAATMQQLAEARQQLEDFELSGLEGEELDRERFRRQQEQFQQQMRDWQVAQAVQEWRNYYGQYTPYAGQVELASMNDPIQMGHQIMANMATRIHTLEQENNSLRGVATQPPAAPPVTTGSGGSPGKRTYLQMTPEEREQARVRIRMGITSVDDLV